MNYMEQVAQILGVELEKEFNVHCDKQVYKFTEHGLLSYSKENQNWIRTYGLLEKLLTGWTEIIKKPILDEAEKEYLRNIIKPFGDRVRLICKSRFSSREHIVIILDDSVDKDLVGYLALPTFKEGTMYKGMELNKRYTLEELGL